jgi:hypothetical protein
MPEQQRGEGEYGGIDWPQIRDMFNERMAQVALADEERRKALDLQREADAKRIADLEKYIVARIEAAQKLVEQFHEQQSQALQQAELERAKSAEVLRNESQRAMDKADSERDKAALVLRDQLQQQITVGDESLRQNLQHLKEQVQARFEASDRAISKQEFAYEKRFEAVSGLQEEQRREMEEREEEAPPEST